MLENLDTKQIKSLKKAMVLVIAEKSSLLNRLKKKKQLPHGVMAEYCGSVLWPLRNEEGLLSWTLCC